MGWLFATAWALCVVSLARADGPPPIPAREAHKTFTIADRLDVRLVASEPLVRQPLSLSFDERGRLWVLEYIQYPNPEGLHPVAVDEYLRTRYDRRPDPPPKGPRGHDCIVILEDTDGDGVFDRGKNFLSGLNLASGMALGYGGVFVAQPPYLLFYRDANGDDVPDGNPEVLLTGFGMEDAHAFANSLTWGPDGWLYGAQGSTVTANIRGIEFQQGIWRYHPRTKAFELFAEGGGNTWGIDFDRFGNLFAGGNTLEPLCHHVQGAYYVKGFGKHGPLHNPHAYGYFQPVKHHGPFGGGLTGGCVIYQGKALPPRFENACIAPNLRQNAIRWYTFESNGSTFDTRPGGDFIVSRDPWFRPVDMLVGPDDALYIADWYDINISHTSPKDRSQWYTPSRNDGRIWRVTAKDRRGQSQGSMAHPFSSHGRQSVDAKSEWNHRETWRTLGEQHDRSHVPLFQARLAQANSGPAALGALWAIGLSDGLDEGVLTRALHHADPYVRAWTIRLLGDKRKVSSETAVELVGLASTDPSVIVRSQLACTAKRLPGPDCLAVVRELVKHDEDAADPHIPLLIWWAVESKAVSDRAAVLDLLNSPGLGRHSIVRDTLVERLARRYLSLGDARGYAACARLLKQAPSHDNIERIVAGMETELSGRRLDKTPPELEAELARLLSDRAPSMAALCLALRLNVPAALAPLIARVRASPTAESERLLGLKALSETGSANCLDALFELIDRPGNEPIRSAALTALGRFHDPRIAGRLLERYSSLPFESRARMIDVLVSRSTWTKTLLGDVAAGRVDPKIITTEQVRRMLLHDDAEIGKQATARWGTVRQTTPREKQGKILAVSQMLARGRGDQAAGHTLFQKQCAICHRLFGEGNQVGPDLTAADRKNLAILLPNVLDPGAVIRPEYRAYNILLQDGRILAGLLAESNPTTVTVLDAKNQRTVIKRMEIEEMKVSDSSLMPDNVLEPLADQQVRDLFAYLRSK